MVETAQTAVEYALDKELMKLYALIVLGLWTFVISDEIFLALGRIMSRMLAVLLQISSLLIVFAGVVGVLRFCMSDIALSGD